MDAELQFHLDARTQHLIASGCSATEARGRARREFGDTLRWKEAGREARGLGWIDGLRADIGQGLRQWRRAPGFAAAAVLSIGVAIGANTAIFSLVNAVILKGLPVEDPGSLVLFGVPSEELGASFPYPLYRFLRESDEVFADVLASASMGPTIEIDGAAERVKGELVSGNYFDVLGVTSHLGRLTTLEDELAAADVIVLDYGYWQSRFGGDRAVIGRSIRLNRRPMTVIGVSAPTFHGIEPGATVSVRVPITLQAAMHGGSSRLESAQQWWLQIMGRLRPGVSHRQATDVLARQYQSFHASLPDRGDWPQRLVLLDGSQGRRTIRLRFEQPLMILSALAAVVLMLVCVNVGNLLLARATARQREMSLRLALGAARSRIIRQLLVETLLLAVTGGLLGMCLSWWGARALATLAGSPPDIGIPIDLRVLGFGLLVTLVAGLLCGLAPAWSSGKAEVNRALKIDAGQAIGGRMTGRKLLVAVQIAMSVALVVGAGLFARTLFNLRHAPFGFQTDRLALITLNPVLAGYANDVVRRFYDDLRQRVTALPGTESAALAVMPLLAGDLWGSGLTLDTGEKDDKPGPTRNAVGADYLRTVGIAIRDGRDFSDTDTLATERVAIVNEAFVRRYFPDGRALGRRIGPGGPAGAARYRIVGVTRDNKVAHVRESASPFWYVPLAQLSSVGQLTLHVRSTGAPENALADVRRVVAELDKNVPVLEAATMAQQIEDQVLAERLLAILANVFAGLAILLAWLGLYGVMSYYASLRAREVSVRMALGATARMILRLMLGQSAFVVATGLLGGVAVAWLTSRQLRSLIFELEPTDPVTLLAAIGVVLFATTIAATLPARRASRVNPAAVLR